MSALMIPVISTGSSPGRRLCVVPGPDARDTAPDLHAHSFCDELGRSRLSPSTGAPATPPGRPPLADRDRLAYICLQLCTVN
ncbi:hypothetical protein GCM10026982_03940 [Nocardiopsis aegyptia]